MGTGLELRIRRVSDLLFFQNARQKSCYFILTARKYRDRQDLAYTNVVVTQFVRRPN